MKPYELFKYIKDVRHNEFITGGDNVQWIVRVFDDEKTVRLIFEESADKRDWINNFNFPIKLYKKQESCIRAARGWGNAYKSCNDEIMDSFIKAVHAHPDYESHICGWSYGGAICLLAAEDFYYRTHIKSNVYTFGAPKPLFGKRCQKYVLSCVNEVKQYGNVNDCVPLMPPFPCYKRLDTTKVGNNFSLFKLFNPNVYHTTYDDKTLYEEKNENNNIKRND